MSILNLSFNSFGFATKVSIKIREPPFKNSILNLAVPHPTSNTSLPSISLQNLTGELSASNDYWQGKIQNDDGNKRAKIEK